jgi:hypothetical protein
VDGNAAALLPGSLSLFKRRCNSKVGRRRHDLLANQLRALEIVIGDPIISALCCLPQSSEILQAQNTAASAESRFREYIRRMGSEESSIH